MGIAQGHTLCSFKDLDDRLIAVDLDNTSDLMGIAAHCHLHDLIVGSILNALQDNQRAIDST